MKYISIVLLLMIGVFLTACNSDSSAPSNNSNNNTAQTTIDYSFNVKIGDDLIITQDDAKINLPYPPGIPAEELPAAFDIKKNGKSIFSLRVELRDDVLAVGESEIERMTARFDADIDGDMQTLGCGGNNGLPDDVFLTITDVTETRLSGNFTITLTSCFLSETGSAFDYEGVTVVADFTNIPYRPED